MVLANRRGRGRPRKDVKSVGNENKVLLKRGRGRPRKDVKSVGNENKVLSKRGRGRPRKDVKSVGNENKVLSKRGRGRPPKDVKSVGNENKVLSKRGRGRPRKDVKSVGNEKKVLTKRGRGRPRKDVKSADNENKVLAKRGRGRPRKTVEDTISVGRGNNKGQSPKQSTSSGPRSQKPLKKISFRTCIKKRIMLFKFRMESQEKDSRGWKKKLLSFIREVYLEVTDRQVNDWIKTHPWIKPYYWKPNNGFDRKIYKTVREDLRKLTDEEEVSSGDNSGSEECGTSLDGETVTESDIRINAVTPEPMHNPVQVGGSSDSANDNSNGARSVANDPPERRPSGQSHIQFHHLCVRLTRLDGSNPIGPPYNEEDQGNGGEKSIRDAETVLSSSPERSAIDTGNRQRDDTERPSTSTKFPKQLERPDKEPSSSRIKTTGPNVENREVVVPVLPITTRTELSSPPTYSQLLNRMIEIVTNPNLLSSLESLRSLSQDVSVDSPSQGEVSGIPPRVPAESGRSDMQNLTDLQRLSQSFETIQRLNYQFGLYEEYRPLLDDLQSMFDILKAEHRRVVMPFSSCRRIVNIQPGIEVKKPEDQ